MNSQVSPGEPDRLTSAFELRVRFYETDLMGIVHHANYLKYFEAGRVDWLKKRGVSYDDWMRAGIHLAVAESHVRYRRPAKFDDLLSIETKVAEVKRATVLYTYRVLRLEPEPRELIAEGHTLLACVGETMGLQRIPAFVVEALSRAEVDPRLARRG